MNVLNEELMDSMLEASNLNQSWKAVKANRGAAGIDGISIGAFPAHLKTHRESVVNKLRAGKYKPAPVKRVYLPKEGGSKRPLGIPTVMDRVIQQAMLQVLQPHFEPHFSEHSYGFRPGRSAHDAIKAAQGYVAEGNTYVVDIDLRSFFDEVSHDKLMHRVAQTIRDKDMLKLIGKYLRSGVYENGQVTTATKGVPQGGPLSPLLANIYLDALDKELERRGLCFCRFADDCNIYVSSEKAAHRVLNSVVHWIEKHLKVPVNHDKSGTGRPWERSFLGYQQTRNGQLRPAPKSLEKLKREVRTRFRGLSGETSQQLRNRWSQYIRGWCEYYKLASAPYWRRDISGWIRRHVRKCFWLRWHCSKGRRNRLRQLGVPERNIERCNLSGASWPSAAHPAMQIALNNRTLRRFGFLTPSDFAPD